MEGDAEVNPFPNTPELYRAWGRGAPFDALRAFTGRGRTPTPIGDPDAPRRIRLTLELPDDVELRIEEDC